MIASALSSMSNNSFHRFVSPTKPHEVKDDYLRDSSCGLVGKNYRLWWQQAIKALKQFGSPQSRLAISHLIER